MQKRHFEAIARCLREERARIETLDDETIRTNLISHQIHMTHLLASVMSGFNPNFDYNRFIRAATEA